MTSVAKLSRREFLALGAAAGGGLALGVYRPGTRRPPLGSSLEPSAFVRVDPDDTVTIWMARADMGQGVRTSLPMIVADELDADWATVRIVQADAHPSKYGRQMTVGSTSVRSGGWTPLRQAGASAREMLLQAGAAHWSVPIAECRTEAGAVIHGPSGRTRRYGDLALAAAQLPVPSNPRLKTPAEFRLIGTRIPQVDLKAKVTGSAGYGTDVRVPGLRFATVVRCPVFEGRVASFDPAPAREVPGVRDVLQIASGVAVVADHTWAAFEGARALRITWDEGGFSLSSAGLTAAFTARMSAPGAVARQDGDAAAGLARAARRLEAVYEAPLLAHATLEPMNCTAQVRGDHCEVWVPTQNPQGAQTAAARLTGLPLDQITVHVTYLGCGWGRRSTTEFVEDAVELSRKTGDPVQVLWTREEDMRHDYYRQAALCRFEAGLDPEGRVTALTARVASTPIGGRAAAVDRNGVDGIANAPYRFAALLVDCHPVVTPIPIGYWRSVGVSQNTFFMESFVDELAHAAGRDPVAFRRELLSQNPRARRVLDLAAEKAGWDGPALGPGRARGVALVEDKESVVAQVAEVSLDRGQVLVHRVVCAADCGQVIHPGIVEAQVAGSVVGGLAAALYGEITLDRGRVTQSNFHDYPLLRMPEAPRVEVHLVPSTDPPGAVGEPALPPIAPAVANALFALTGQRVRRLPIRLQA